MSGVGGSPFIFISSIDAWTSFIRLSKADVSEGLRADVADRAGLVAELGWLAWLDPRDIEDAFDADGE